MPPQLSGLTRPFLTLTSSCPVGNAFSKHSLGPSFLSGQTDMSPHFPGAISDCIVQTSPAWIDCHLTHGACILPARVTLSVLAFVSAFAPGTTAVEPTSPSPNYLRRTLVKLLSKPLVPRVCCHPPGSPHAACAGRLQQTDACSEAWRWPSPLSKPGR